MATPDQIRKRTRLSLVLGTIVAALLFGAIAYADVVQPDADFVTVGNQSSLNLGTVPPGATLTPQVSFELQCGGNQHVDDGLSVSLTYNSGGSTIPPGGSMSASTATIGPVPAAWPDDQGQCSNPAPAALQDNGNSTVTITAPTTPGNYSFVAKWTVVEPETSDVTGADPIVTFTLTVAAPADTTPPVISYALTPGSPDGDNGWYRSNVALVWTVTEAESLGSLVKTGCADQNITADQAATTYSCSATSAGGSSGPVSVTIKRDATAPSAVTTLDSAPNGSNGWYTTAPAWTTNGADSLSGLVNAPCAAGTYAGPEGTGLIVSGACTDNAGNSASDDSPSFKFDATGPSAALGVTAGTLGANSWYTSDVTVHASGTDSSSSPVACTADQLQTNETSGQSFTGSCANEAGLSTSAGSLTIKLDKSAPAITDLGPTTSPNGNGWYQSDVVNRFQAADGVSGLDSDCLVAYPLSGSDRIQSKTTTGEGAAVAVTSDSCADLAGNTAAAKVSASFQIDQTLPTASASGSPAANGNGWNNTDVTVTFSGSDGLSGIDFCDPAVVLASEGAGQSASGACTDKAGNVSASATTSGINIDKTAPSVSAGASPAPNANGWNKADVTVHFSGTDELSGIDSCHADTVLSSEGANQSASGTCTDRAGNESDPATASGINIDKTAPVITDLGPTTLPNANGWYRTDVVNQFKASDPVSGLNGACESAFPDPVLGGRRQDKTTSGEGAAVTVTSNSCTDLAGNTAAAKTSDAFKIDETKPGASASASPAPNANGWNKMNVTVTFSGSDPGGSGIDSCHADTVLSSEGANQSASGTCTDKAGNESDPATASGINIDKTAPALTWTGGPANGSSHYYGSVPPAPTCAAVDTLSGPDTCAVTGYATTVGPHTMTATATDKAGNVYTEQRSYTVLSWTLTGFFQPVDMGNVLNVVKNGSTVPLKFKLYAGATELTDVADVKSLKYGQVACDASAPNDDVETVATGGTVLRYDTGQFIYNWKTPSLPGKCVSVTMTTQDGSSLTAFFKLK
jgi:hypothetical protein